MLKIEEAQKAVISPIAGAGGNRLPVCRFRFSKFSQALVSLCEFTVSAGVDRVDCKSTPRVLDSIFVAPPPIADQSQSDIQGSKLKVELKRFLAALLPEIGESGFFREFVLSPVRLS